MWSRKISTSELPSLPEAERPPVQYPQVTSDKNPFAVDYVHAIKYQFSNSSWDDILERCEKLKYRGAIIGPHGFGKTTLQTELAQHFQNEGVPIAWLRLTFNEPKFPKGFLKNFFDETSKKTLIFFDGAEQLSDWQWKRFLKQSEGFFGLIITTHQPGRLPTIFECTTSIDLLENLVERLAPQSKKTLLPYLPRLFEWYSGNIRGCVRELYNWTANGRILG